MRLKINAILFLLTVLPQWLQAQVWFPEGVYTQAPPSLITVDNQVITIARTGTDLSNSYWQVCVNDGRSWLKLPLLTLSKSAEVLDIKKYQGMVYVCGNFTFDNGSFNAIVRYNNNGWQGLGNFRKPGALPAQILSMDVQNLQLVLGGSFYTIGNDTLPYLARFNGFKFSEYFDKCKDCGPDNTVIDIASNDSVVAICGQFTRIRNQKTKYLYRLIRQTTGDTFLNTPKLIEKIALHGTTMYGTGGVFNDKRVYRINGTVTDVSGNLDSAAQISEILIWEGKPVLSGNFYLASNASPTSIILMEGSDWKSISNNYRNASYIATGRSVLFAAGNAPQPLSIWNPNRFVVRFYPNLCLVKAGVFIDSNNNCIREAGEKPVAKQYIRLPYINKGVFTNDKGFAEFMVPNNIQNTFRFAIKPFRNIVRSNCADTAVTKTFYPGVYSDSIQFPLKRLPNINDVRVLIASPRGKQVLKNKKVQYYIVYENVGSNPISGSIKLQKSKLFTREQADPAFKSRPNDSTLVWEYTNLQAGERKTILYTAYPEDAQFDQQWQFDAKVAVNISSGSSAYAEDDFDSIPQESNQTVAAFRKDVYPTPLTGDSITYLDAGDRDLRYNISFNNFSSDTVFYAVVIDTLDLNLDMSYIEETGSNKSYFTEVQTDPNNQYKGILIWHFPNIRLSPNPLMDYENTGSGSYIGFKVVTKPLSQGYYLKNRAAVFFDNEFAGNTNAVYCTLAITGIDEMSGGTSGLRVWPNPVSDVFDLQYGLKQGDILQITDASGKLVYTELISIDADLHRIAAGTLPSGIYVLQVISASGIVSAKIVR